MKKTRGQLNDIAKGLPTTNLKFDVTPAKSLWRIARDFAKLAEREFTRKLLFY